MSQPITFVDQGAAEVINLGPPGNGVTVLDYDQDGFLDLIMAKFTGGLGLFHNVPDLGRPGERTFEDVSEGSGIEGHLTNRDSIVAADYDADGDPDVFLTSGALFRNDGGGVFTEVTNAAGLGSIAGEGAAGWADFDLDGWVDLLVFLNSPPRLFLMKNQGDGTFTDVTSQIQYTFPEDFRIAFTLLWFDYDQDGWSDVFIPADLNDDSLPILLQNMDDGNGGRTFVENSQAAGFTNLGPAAMGIAAGDYDGDGDLDLGISDAATGTFYENLGGTFQLVTPATLIFGWGVEWLDADNDRDLDFFESGNAFSGPPPLRDQLFRNTGAATFDDITTSLNAVQAYSMYSVQLDYDNDGLQDIIALAPDDFVSVYENITPTSNHWLQVELEGFGGVNRDAIGAIVRVTSGGVTQIRELFCGSSTSATEDQRLHFGLGDHTTVDSIEVVWPWNGSVAERTEVFAGPFAVDQLVSLMPTSPPAVVFNDDFETGDATRWSSVTP